MNSSFFNDVNLGDLLDILRNLVIIVGGIYGVRNYAAQNHQKAIDNAYNLIENFKETVAEENIELWRSMFFATSESVGAQPKHFLVFRNGQRTQIPIHALFITEGKGFLLDNATFGKQNSDSPLSGSTIQLGGIRLIAEQLEIMSYEILKGNVEPRIIYYEIGQIIFTIYRWLDQVENARERESTQFRFRHFIRMYKKYRKAFEDFPYKLIANID